MRIVSTMSINPEYLESAYKKYPSIEWIIKDKMEEARPYLPEADILLTLGFDTEAEDIKVAEKIKWVHVFSAGVDEMPFDVIQDKNALLTNTKGIHKIPMSEYVIGVMMNHVKFSFFFHEMQQQKKWNRKIDGGELYGKTVVVVGTGSIGQEIAKKAKVFDMKTIGVNTTGQEEEFFDQMYPTDQLNEALSQGDFVVLVVPLTQKTKNLISKPQFEVMKENAYFINIARGPVVNEKDMVDALKQKIIAGAALDVFEKEPLSTDSPLWDLDNVYITPHVSGVTARYRQRAVEMFLENLDVYMTGEGKYINVVDVSKQY